MEVTRCFHIYQGCVLIVHFISFICHLKRVYFDPYQMLAVFSNPYGFNISGYLCTNVSVIGCERSGIIIKIKSYGGVPAGRSKVCDRGIDDYRAVIQRRRGIE